MRCARLSKILWVTALVAGGGISAATGQNVPGYVSLFDGVSLNGWTLVGKRGEGYGVKDGVIYCAKGGGGNLYTEKEYSDFVLRLESRLEKGSNNGVGIRAPLEGAASSLGMEIQVLDDDDPQYARLRPAQYCGSIYDVVPATRGALNKVGGWNSEVIIAKGRNVGVLLNDKRVVVADLNTVTDPQTLGKHPGLLRPRGHIGFLGHNDYVEFRNIRILELPGARADNLPPEGFHALFDGKDLTGWKGLVADPPQRARMSAGELTAAQAKADERMRAHWNAADGVLNFDGKGDSLCTAKDYGNFEMWVDWKIGPKGDSGIYLRGSPQVQIWEPASPGQFNPPDGSGGLYNNEKNPRHPLTFADKPVGEWNHFQILMTGGKVTVYLNDVLVVNNVTLENYWERDKPIYPVGQLELQSHSSPLWFKNVYLRELPGETNAALDQRGRAVR